MLPETKGPSKTEGVYEGEAASYFTGTSADGRKLVVVFRDIELYRSFHLSLFSAAAALFILNLAIALVVRQKLTVISRSLDITIPAITAAARDIAETISKVDAGARDLVELSEGLSASSAEMRDMALALEERLMQYTI